MPSKVKLVGCFFVLIQNEHVCIFSGLALKIANLGPFQRCHFPGSSQVTLSNFPEILLKLSLPLMMNICKNLNEICQEMA